ncbi:MerR family transcriptional regulator [Apilactobacillus kunkeei]|uniref:MerR family transcriptional regulator n=1 Tax=Apilactobacillus kunkeei TaxID=148814 RepID=UPI0006B24228|nr:MerR family transcriptional regulator [Apilactobacillus kunkeei]KOY70493.1 Transcriptional regulator, MerR family protein [Apilactobacillus kunkeei]CAI2556420.1 HTH-type transcriptional regulator AdhR [Apilactobacillus kunkeei]CAI2556514.1 HTH-type transcriptional regulator AdhR [Apilactobacillus kunkeei]CAI2556605.1 HTH-type transcriptional regulator AdhR [Apilactobacillus kunkeei]CAI2556834.1 HTH-type transcriptional regulator AdhR [Apilactobacillus kunkeei]
MNIKEASQITDVPASTIRYYEKEHIIPAVDRNDSGVRDFDDHAIRRISFAKKMRDAGMEISTLKKYINLFDNVENSEDQQLALLVEQKRIMEAKHDKMQDAINLLENKIENFDTHMLKVEDELRTMKANKKERL